MPIDPPTAGFSRTGLVSIDENGFNTPAPLDDPGRYGTDESFYS